MTSAVGDGGALLTLAGTIMTALFVLVGTWLTSRQTHRAALRTAEIERDKLEAQRDTDAVKADAVAYASAREIWDALVNDLRTQISDYRQEVKDLRTNVSAYHADITALRGRIDSLEQRDANSRRQLRLASTYIDELIASHLRHNITPPPPPTGLDLTPPP